MLKQVQHDAQKCWSAARPPLALIAKDRGALRITAPCPRATSLGLMRGMALADARALVPDLAVADADPDRDAAALARLADLCLAYAPGVSIDADAALVLLDIAGATHFWAQGGDPDAAEAEARLALDAVQRLAATGFTARAGLGATPDAAGACAIHGADEADVALLPLAALRLGDDVTRALTRAGLTSIGALGVRPRGALAARFGALLIDRLDRLLGSSDVRITPRRTAPPLIVEARFAEPIATVDAVRASLRDLTVQLGEILAAQARGGRRFVVSLFRTDHHVARLAIDTGAPTRDAALIDRLFAERIDSLADPLDPGFGYDMITLAVPRHEVLTPDQLPLAGGVGAAMTDAAEYAALIDRLTVRLGTCQVRRFHPGDSHIPEQAMFELPAIAAPSAAGWVATEAGEPPLRPFHLFDPPQRVEVIAEIPDGPPRQFRWRRTAHHVVRFEGPERIAAEWWRRAPGKALRTRDYYRVEDARGRRFWLFRHGLYDREPGVPHWYIHGLFA